MATPPYLDGDQLRFQTETLPVSAPRPGVNRLR